MFGWLFGTILLKGVLLFSGLKKLVPSRRASAETFPVVLYELHQLPYYGYNISGSFKCGQTQYKGFFCISPFLPGFLQLVFQPLISAQTGFLIGAWQPTTDHSTNCCLSNTQKILMRWRLGRLDLITNSKTNTKFCLVLNLAARNHVLLVIVHCPLATAFNYNFELPLVRQLVTQNRFYTSDPASDEITPKHYKTVSFI